MEIIVSPCCSANLASSGSRFIDPSSLTISTSTPAWVRPANRGQVHGGLGVPAAHEHAALAVAQREHVPRAG